MKTKELWAKNMLGNYALPGVTITRGCGSYAWDDEGKRYLDFSSGIAVLSLGHCHPVWTDRLKNQLGTLTHCSNIFMNENAPRAAERIVRHMGGGRVFFCNSGAEANEAMLKLARLHGNAKAGGEEEKIYKVVCCENAFHGRLFGTMAVTPQEKIQHGFRPLAPGAVCARINDIESFKAAIDDETAAVILECVQGESGLTVAEPEFLKELRALCDEKNVLMLCDEIQCGIGRTGTLFAFEQAGIVPDAFSMAKGLGGGFPIGAMWCKETCADYFHPGSHGTTFGGNPLATAAALAVFDIIAEEKLLDNVNALAPAWREGLKKLVDDCPGILKEVRGTGFMSGLMLTEAPAPWIAKLREAGLLCVGAGNNVIRLLPPLTANKYEFQECLEILRKVFAR
ncbi:MAG: aspartate aminotransferase family protein [Opitutales bacterium]|nr:aspartate aminotransferase family protein [Opitutales bacterium]